MKKTHCIIKVTNGCNLHCSYCYNSVGDNAAPVISLDKIDKFFSLFNGFDCIEVIFHGGEPLLAGTDFFKKVMELERIYSVYQGVTFENVIQTNATLIDSRWLSFFKKNGFTVGISYDGLNNEECRGGTDKVLRAVDMLHKNRIPFGNIAVVADRAYDIRANYAHFKSLNLPTDFNYVFKEGRAKSMDVMPVEDYIEQMLDLFDLWIYDTDGIAVRNFDMMVKKVLKTGRDYCCNMSCIGNFFCMDTDGSIYGCGRESVRQYRFGCVDDFASSADIVNSENFINYLKGSIARRKHCAEVCPYFDECKGGCSDTAITGGDITSPNEVYCRYFTAMYSRVKQKTEEIFADGTDLSKLNPCFRAAVVQAASISEEE